MALLRRETCVCVRSYLNRSGHTKGSIRILFLSLFCLSLSFSCSVFSPPSSLPPLPSLWYFLSLFLSLHLTHNLTHWRLKRTKHYTLISVFILLSLSLSLSYTHTHTHTHTHTRTNTHTHTHTHSHTHTHTLTPSHSLSLALSLSLSQAATNMVAASESQT